MRRSLMADLTTLAQARDLAQQFLAEYRVHDGIAVARLAIYRGVLTDSRTTESAIDVFLAEVALALLPTPHTTDDFVNLVRVLRTSFGVCIGRTTDPPPGLP